MVQKVVGRDRLREDDFVGQNLRSVEPFAEADFLHKNASASFLVAILGIQNELWYWPKLDPYLFKSSYLSHLKPVLGFVLTGTTTMSGKLLVRPRGTLSLSTQIWTHGRMI